MNNREKDNNTILVAIRIRPFNKIEKESKQLHKSFSVTPYGNT